MLSAYHRTEWCGGPDSEVQTLKVFHDRSPVGYPMRYNDHTVQMYVVSQRETGFQFGRGGISCRFYDKAYEISVKGHGHIMPI